MSISKPELTAFAAWLNGENLDKVTALAYKDRLAEVRSPSRLQFFTVEAVQLGQAEVANTGKARTVFLPGKL